METTGSPCPVDHPTTGLLTDKYELTMLSSFVADGTAEHDAVFELFARRLPEGRRFGILGGLGRFLDALEDFTFTSEEKDWLIEDGALTPEAADWLGDFRFSGDIRAYAEGDLYWPNSPILTVTGRLGECILLETLALSIFNHDSAIASAAARMAIAADGRPLMEMGSRRAHEMAAVAVGRAAYLAGFSGTSNLATGKQYGVPTIGTAAHAFTLAHRTERDAFAAQIRALGVGTTLLVDTYDTEEGIRTAIEVAGPELGAIRLDSGDLSVEARKARALLDELGATGTKIIVTSDLDEYVISALADAPIDGYGVGTRVATGSGHPTASMVYKLVAVAHAPGGELTSVAKASENKGSIGGEKTAYRYPDGREHFRLDGTVPDGAEPLQHHVVRGGAIAARPTLEASRAFVAERLTTLPAEVRQVAHGSAYQFATEENPDD
ncbi:MAG: nicotinate phosphoribosyltransferase [Actinomycetia bacterium]|nr:nicotinate phosphoribosyltransferase [Actinomycetes bacterium]